MIPVASGSTVRAIAAALSLALLALPACSSSKSKATPEQRMELGEREYETQIRRVVGDRKRADELVDLASEFQSLVEQAARSFRAQHTRLAQLNASYDTTVADFEALFAQADADRAALLEKAVDLRTRMAALTTDAEWSELKKARVAEWQNELADVPASL
jgi:septal ring factor EnvC (AmiA/AmiB activator)